MPVSSLVMQQRARDTAEQLAADAGSASPSSEAYRALTATQQRLRAVCHRWTVANRPPSADPVFYDWTDRVVGRRLEFTRNGWDQPIAGKAKARLMLSPDDLSDLSWGSLLLHFWVTVTDETSGAEATFEYGSWAVASQSRCTDFRAPDGLGDMIAYDVRLYDRLGWLNIQNQIGWDIDLAQGWSLQTEIDRIVQQSDAPWQQTTAGIFAARHDVSVRVDATTRNDAADNSLRWAAGETTWLNIVNDLSQLGVERGTLAYCAADGSIVVPSWRAQSGQVGNPVWRFDSASPDSVIVGQPQEHTREVWNQPNRWIAIGTADLAGEATEARGNAVVDTGSEYGTVATGRTITEVLRMETRDRTKLTNLALFASYCAGQDARQVSIDCKPLPHLWHNDIVTLQSVDTYGDMSPRNMVASEWKLTFDGKPMKLLLRQVPRISDYTHSAG